MNEWMDEWVNGWIDGWMDWWMDEGTRLRASCALQAWGCLGFYEGEGPMFTHCFCCWPNRVGVPDLVNGLAQKV